MAFQISIGDVLMLSKLAWNIAQAFSSGRGSAPAEFQEVQNQLQSLCHALDSVKLLSSQRAGDSTAGTIAPILQNCRSTLEHLEAVVNKYMIMDTPKKTKDSKSRQWHHEIHKNWKKIRWTREGGDLARLQHNLGVHVNSLNLTITVFNCQMSQKTGKQVEGIHEMLIGIYAWFNRNLKDPATSSYDISHGAYAATPELLFSLHTEDPENYHILPLCDNAGFNPGWLQVQNKPIFKCKCQLRRTAHGDIHDEELSHYFLCPTSLIVRLDGPSQSWKIWLSSEKTSRLTSLIIHSIDPSKLATFEQTISDLAIATAKPAIERGLGSLMVLPSMNPHTGYPVISVLNLLCDTRRLHNKIGNIQLTTNGHSFLTGPVEMAQLMHYRHLTVGGEWLYGETADIILDTRVDSQNTEMAGFTLTVSSQTRISAGENQSNIRLFPCDCLSISKSGQRVVKGVDVEIEVAEEQARYLLQQLRRLQDGLLLFRTQQVQRNEKTLFQLGLTQVLTYDYHVKNATVKLCENLETKNCRLLVSNDARSMCLSIEISLAELERIVQKNEPTVPVENCWVAETKTESAHVYQEKGKSTLTCNDPYTQKLLMLMLQSVVRGEGGVEMPIIEGRRYNELEG